MQSTPTSDKDSWHLPLSVSALVLTCFFFSGLTGLIYEILWTRMIVKVIGSAPFAVSIILTVFMGGLGLGSFLAGRIIDRMGDPRKLLRTYALLEFAIGGYGVILPGMIIIAEPLYSILYNQIFSHFLIYSLLTLFGCLILLILPSTCMGATLPVLCRFYIVQLDHLGTRAGRLYALNTIGAAAGSFVCGFWLIAYLGVWGTLLSAVLLNGIIGAVCFVISYRGGIRLSQGISAPPPAAGSGKIPENTASGIPASTTGHAFVTLSIFAVSGFCAMAYEVIWTKLLGLIIGPTIYSFTIILTTFITGLGLGSMFFGWLADRIGKPLRLLLYTQIMAAILALAVSQLLGNSQFFFAKLIYHLQARFGLLAAAKAGILFLMMIGPTLFLGATFPLVGKIYTRSLSRIGYSIGFAYTINTLGAVLGSFCAGFLLIPLLGKELSLSLVVGLQLVTSLGVGGYLLWESKGRHYMQWIPAAIVSCSTIMLCLYLPHWNRQQLSLGRYHRFDDFSADISSSGWLEAIRKGPSKLEKYEANTRLLYYGDGIGGFTTVLKITNLMGEDEYLLLNSGKGDASSRGDMPTQTLTAHVPLLLHPDAQEVLVVGLASGVTAGEVLNYPVRKLDIVDISEEVVKASNYFIPWNNQVLANPRTELIIQDARAHLELTERSYDVIIAEPSNPWMAGLANLFTRECFLLARDRLKDNGIFVQMFHSYQMDWTTFAMVGRTFHEAFPRSMLMVTYPSAPKTIRADNDYLFIGFKGEKESCTGELSRDNDYASRSSNINLPHPRLLYRLIVSEDLGTLFGSGPLHTDNLPLLEFAAPKEMYTSDPTIEQTLSSRRWLSGHTTAALDAMNKVEDQIDFSTFALSVYQPFHHMTDLARATPQQRERFAHLVESYCARTPVDDYSVIGDQEMIDRCVALQIEATEKNIHLIPDKAIAYDHLGTAYDTLGELDKAIAFYQKALQEDQPTPGVLYNLGIAYGKKGDLEGAITSYQKALAINPHFVRALNNLGNAYIAKGELTQAVEVLTRALAINPGFAEAHNNLGNAYIKQEEVDKAIAEYERATAIQPGFAEAHYNVGVAYRRKRQLNKAIASLQKAVAIHPDYAKAHYHLAIAYYYDKQYKLALIHCNKAIALGSPVDPKLLELLKPYDETGSTARVPG